MAEKNICWTVDVVNFNNYNGNFSNDNPIIYLYE